MKHNTLRVRLAAAAAATAVFGGLAVAYSTAESETQWDTGWMAAPQLPSIGFEPNWAQDGFDNQTVRQVVRLTDGGTAARITLSNRYGTTPLRVGNVTLARTAAGAEVDPDSVRPLTFGGSTTTEIPAGGTLTSDSVDLDLRALDSATVSIFFPERTGPATFHSQAYASTYRAAGDQAGAAAGPFTEATHSWYYLTDLQVSGDDDEGGTVVAMGDSITDGYGSGYDTNTRYPDWLAQRLADAGTPRPVLNAGIGGNLILNDSSWFGEAGVRRFERDVLGQRDVSSVIVFGGLNDFGFSEVDLPTYKPNPQISVAQLIAGHRELIAAAHRAGVRVTGATLLPMKGAEYYNEVSAAKIREFNEWLRTSGEYDAVVDFNAAVRDPADPESLLPAFDSGDHKHPNAAGYRAMAEAIDLATL
ncbi:SGNH/GDSL hydrolase family protein [Nocardia sp. NPDC048505]|uniref:SGNH/GDSL hydrolase family protein n=1 Tax=unclassified Nocardia TaxID=2637762 RepID=UPI0033C191C2